jgi:hypothetical protein
VVSTKRERRKAKKGEKQKKKRSGAQKRRAASTVSARRAGAASDWPVGECYISEHWHERGAQVHAVFSRRHTGGAVAYAHFEVDLTERGVIEASDHRVDQEQLLHAQLAGWSERKAMVVAEPALVVKLVTEGKAYGRENGHRPPKGYGDAISLFGEVDPGSCTHIIDVGEADTDEVPKKKESWLGGLKKRFGMGG